MKDIISEKLMILATAQETIDEVADRLERMDNSLLVMEQYSFKLLNNFDKLIYISKEGMLLADRLKEACNIESVIERDKLVHMIDEIQNHFLHIYNTSLENSNSSHEIETETVYQREYKEFITESLPLISDSINSAVACADLMLAQL